MAERVPGEVVRQIVGVELSDQEAAALADWYANLVTSLAVLPQAELKELEPPLRSVPGPRS